jgi:hypothetical protein
MSQIEYIYYFGFQLPPDSKPQEEQNRSSTASEAALLSPKHRSSEGMSDDAAECSKEKFTEKPPENAMRSPEQETGLSSVWGPELSRSGKKGEAQSEKKGDSASLLGKLAEKLFKTASGSRPTKNVVKKVRR